MAVLSSTLCTLVEAAKDYANSLDFDSNEHWNEGNTHYNAILATPTHMPVEHYIVDLKNRITSTCKSMAYAMAEMPQPSPTDAIFNSDTPLSRVYIGNTIRSGQMVDMQWQSLEYSFFQYAVAHIIRMHTRHINIGTDHRSF